MSMTWPVPSFPPRVYTPSSVVNSVGAVERVAISGDGALIPDVYGRQRVPAEIVTPVVYDDDTLYILCVWCTGEIQAINGVYMGDVQIDAANLHNYRGTSGQAVDTWMAAAIPAYADALTGIAYSVLKVTKAMGLNSRIWADISGRNDIYDPRTSSTGYSTNPSLCLANFIDRYLPVTVLNSGLIACANANDVAIGGVPRESLNITIRTPAPIETHAAVLSEYANCFIHWGPDVVLTPNRTKTADHVFTDATIKDLIVRKPGMDQQPNRVTVEYTDISGTEWKSALVTHSDVAPGAEVREQVLQMPGIQNYGHASRYAHERLNYYRQTDIRLTVDVFDEGASVIVGDRITITHKYGLTARDFWVVAVEALDAGRYRIEAEGYSSSIYVTTNPTAPTLSDPAYPTENDYSAVKGMFTTYRQADPPASASLGDLWIDTDNNRMYRWDGALWEEVQDDDIAQALANALAAQNTADARVSTWAQTSPPIANAEGDLWIETDDSNELHRWNGSAWVSQRDGTIAVAQADALQALADAAFAQATANSRITTFYSAGPPAANVTGDLWFDTDDHRAYRWSGSTWVDMQDDDIAQALSDAADAQTTADGKIVTFAQTSQPAAAAVGDLWIETDDSNELHRWNGSAWVSYRDGTIATANANALQALANAATAQATANTRATTFYNASPPAANATGDLWFDIDDHRAYRWNGSSWIDLQDDDIAQALSDAATAQATADGKIVTFRQTSPPTADGQGDLWIDSDDNNRLYRWNGSSWVDNRDPVASWVTIEDYAGMPQLIPNGLRHGGAMTITFNENKLSNGSSNDGEIQVKAGRYRMPDGTIRTVASDIHVYTPWEGGSVPYDGNFYLMWGATSAGSRWAGDYGNTAGFFTIHEDRATGVKYVADNTVPNKAVYTPLSTDWLMAVGTKSAASGGIATLSPIPQVVGELALNALVSQSLVEDGAVVAASQSNFYTDSSFDSVPPSSLNGSTNQISTGTFRTPADLTDTTIMLDFTFAVRCNFTYTGDTADDIAKYVQIFWKLYNGSANGTATDATTSVYLRCVKDELAAGGIYKGFGYFTLQLPLDVSALSPNTNYTPGLKIRYNSADSNYVFNPIQLSHRSGRAIIMNKSKPVVTGGWLM